MKQSISLKPTALANHLIAIIIVLVPFDAFLTVWIASGFGHYTALRLWDELFLIAGLLIAAGLCFKYRIWHSFKNTQVFWLIAAYIILQVALGIVSYTKQDVSAKALGYGWIVDLRYLLFFWLCFVIASRSEWLKKHWRELFFIPAVIVVAFGLLQHFILPTDFLRHFGYNAQTIFPYETINHNAAYVRIMSTLRGANPLGAYLVIVIAGALAEFLRERRRNYRVAYGALLVGSLITLFYSYSRSAWVGAGISLVIVLLVSTKNKRLKQTVALGLVGLVIITAVIGLALRNNARFENILTHTQQHSAIKTTSDQGHASGLKSGIKDVLHQPLGLGPGTAGPASVYNNFPARIAENYFVQIAQEVGWVGLIIFLLINWLVAKDLWHNRADQLSLVLLASLAGITFVNLLSHAWADDTLSYIWWGLTGIALAPTLNKLKIHAKKIG